MLDEDQAKREIGPAIFIENVCQEELLTYKEASAFLYHIKTTKGKLTYAVLENMNILPPVVQAKPVEQPKKPLVEAKVVENSLEVPVEPAKIVQAIETTIGMPLEKELADLF